MFRKGIGYVTLISYLLTSLSPAFAAGPVATEEDYPWSQASGSGTHNSSPQERPLERRLAEQVPPLPLAAAHEPPVIDPPAAAAPPQNSPLPQQREPSTSAGRFHHYHAFTRVSHF